MIFHLGYELPSPREKELDETVCDFTSEELKIVKEQILKNATLIIEYIDRLDLLVNKERYPNKDSVIQKIRGRLYLLMEENDTFRRVLWKQTQRGLSHERFS